jgi:hypothetical protein
VDYLALVLNEVPETFNQVVLGNIIKHSVSLAVLIVVVLALHYVLKRIAKATKPKSWTDDNVPYVLSYVGMVFCWLTAAIAIPMNVFYLVELLVAPRAYFVSYFF